MEDPTGLREEVLKLVYDRYGVKEEYLWHEDPDSAVLRHKENRKWFALIMYVKRFSLGLFGEGSIDVLNLKCGSDLAGSLRLREGILPAYHMNRKHWISILLDGTVPLDQISSLIDISFDLTERKSASSRRISTWLIPANPKYYDVEAAFDENEVIDWKQSSSVHVGDIVYMYVASPCSAIRFKCRAEEVDIPCSFSSGKLNITRLMRIRRLEKYDQEPISLDLMKESGVAYVRGPRSMPESLVREIERRYGKAES